jgi:hypothetical protein
VVAACSRGAQSGLVADLFTGKFDTLILGELKVFKFDCPISTKFRTC